jgi:MFS transporter, DHA1 family, multidrug resistance protein
MTTPSPPYIRRAPLIAVLISLSAGGLVASDINLPGMALAAASFGVPVQSLQHSFGFYVCGLALAQAFAGPLSDRLGRRGLIVAGLSLFALSSLACAAAPTVELFTIARVLQAIGAGTGLVLGRAVVGDLFAPREAAKMFTSIMPVVGMSPALSPLVGSLLTEMFGWRFPFLVLFVIAITTILMVLLYVPETQPDNARSPGFFSAMASYPKLLRSALFWAYTLNLCAAYIIYFGYLGASPVILSGLELGTGEIGFCYISLAAAYVMGNLTSRRMLKSASIDRLLAFGYGVLIAGAALLVFLNFSVNVDVIMLSLLMAIMTFGNGFLIPLSYAGGVTHFSKVGGAVSGLMGATQLSAAAISIDFVSYAGKTITEFSIFAIVVTISFSIMFTVFLRLGLRKEKGLFTEQEQAKIVHSRRDVVRNS